MTNPNPLPVVSQEHHEMTRGDFFRFWDHRVPGWMFGRCRENSEALLVFDVWVTPLRTARWTMPHDTAAPEVAETLKACEVLP